MHVLPELMSLPMQIVPQNLSPRADD